VGSELLELAVAGREDLEPWHGTSSEDHGLLVWRAGKQVMLGFMQAGVAGVRTSSKMMGCCRREVGRVVVALGSVGWSLELEQE
jgi:hypothetical protein